MVLYWLRKKQSAIKPRTAVSVLLQPRGKVCACMCMWVCVCFMCYAGLAGGAFQALAKTCLHFTCSPFCSPFVWGRRCQTIAPQSMWLLTRTTYPWTDLAFLRAWARLWEKVSSKQGCLARFLGSKGSINFVKVLEPSNRLSSATCNFGNEGFRWFPWSYPSKTCLYCYTCILCVISNECRNNQNVWRPSKAFLHFKLQFWT